MTNLDFILEVPAFNCRLTNVTLMTLGRSFPHISLISASRQPPVWRHMHRSARKKNPLKVVFFVLVMKKGFFPLNYRVSRHHLKKTYIPDLSSPLRVESSFLKVGVMSAIFRLSGKILLLIALLRQSVSTFMFTFDANFIILIGIDPLTIRDVCNLDICACTSSGRTCWNAKVSFLWHP